VKVQHLGSLAGDQLAQVAHGVACPEEASRQRRTRAQAALGKLRIGAAVLDHAVATRAQQCRLLLEAGVLPAELAVGVVHQQHALRLAAHP
jgi:hypothetical protein